jgi:hypothetical protein
MNRLTDFEWLRRCSPCPAGTYGEAEGVTDESSCRECLAGRFSAERGAGSEEACEPCAAGAGLFAGAADEKTCVYPFQDQNWTLEAGRALDVVLAGQNLALELSRPRDPKAPPGERVDGPALRGWRLRSDGRGKGSPALGCSTVVLVGFAKQCLRGTLLGVFHIFALAEPDRALFLPRVLKAFARRF